MEKQYINEHIYLCLSFSSLMLLIVHYVYFSIITNNNLKNERQDLIKTGGCLTDCNDADKSYTSVNATERHRCKIIPKNFTKYNKHSMAYEFDNKTICDLKVSNGVYKTTSQINYNNEYIYSDTAYDALAINSFLIILFSVFVFISTFNIVHYTSDEFSGIVFCFIIATAITLLGLYVTLAFKHFATLDNLVHLKKFLAPF